MNELQLRLEVKGAVQNYVEQLLFQNGVPAHLLEEALTASLGYVREKATLEFLQSALNQPVVTPTEEKEEMNGAE